MTGAAAVPERNTESHRVAPRFDARALRDAAGQFASGITVVSVAVENVVHGMTANSFISVSLDPALVLISVANQARLLPLLGEGERFGISVLCEQQRQVSQQFSGRGVRGFEASFEAVAGVPVVPGALCRFACRVHKRVPAGDHTLILGEVLELDRRSGDPLLYFAGHYRAVRKVDEELAYASLF